MAERAVSKKKVDAGESSNQPQDSEGEKKRYRPPKGRKRRVRRPQRGMKAAEPWHSRTAPKEEKE